MREFETVSSRASPHLPTVVGLTTLPSRIEHLRPTLESLMQQTRPPDRILLSLPDTSTRESSAYQVPAWLAQWGPPLEIVRCGPDWGPGTKAVGALRALDDASCLVLVDDDMAYEPYLLEMLHDAVQADPSRAYSFYAYPCGPLMVGQGADGFGMHTRHLGGLARFAEQVVGSRRLRVVDDLWISAYLHSRGVPVQGLQHSIPGQGLVYQSTHGLNQLHDLDGDLAREHAMLAGLQELLEAGHLGRGRQAVAKVKRFLRKARSLADSD